MPIYNTLCNSCGATDEVLLSINDYELAKLEKHICGICEQQEVEFIFTFPTSLLHIYNCSMPTANNKGKGQGIKVAKTERTK